MPFGIRRTERAVAQMEELERSDPKRLKKVRKTLAFLGQNPRHPSLQTHAYDSIVGPNGKKVWEAYVENKNPAAFRVLWCYGPGDKEITVLSVTAHP